MNGSHIDEMANLWDLTRIYLFIYLFSPNGITMGNFLHITNEIFSLSLEGFPHRNSSTPKSKIPSAKQNYLEVTISWTLYGHLVQPLRR